MIDKMKPILIERDLLKYPAAEVGVAEGRTSLDLLSAGIPKLYMVDLWGFSEPVRDGKLGFTKEWHDSNLAGAKNRVGKFGDKAVFLRGWSVEMSRQIQDSSLGFVYLDASHSKRDVLDDLVAWYPKLVKGGVMSGHDYLNPSITYGVKEAVTEFTNSLNPIPKISVIGEAENASFYFFKG